MERAITMDRAIKFFTLVLSGLVLSLSMAGSSHADGLYIGAGVYQSEADYKGFDDEETVPAAFVGFNFLDTNILMVSVEVGYYDLGDFSADGVKIEADMLTAAAVVYLPIGPFFEVYAKAGVAGWEADIETANGFKDNSDGSDPFGGVGISLDLFDTIDIYAEYLVVDNSIDSEMLGIGVRLDF